MRIAVVDDESIYTDQIKNICMEFEPQYEGGMEISSFSDGQAFLDAFQPGAYQVVFMDIFMNELNGMDAARKIRETDTDCFLVFLTSSSEFMLDAFACHAFDYVVKPFTADRILQVLSDVQARIPGSALCIEITSDRRVVSLPLSDIVSVVNDAHYLDICMRDGTHLRSRMTAGRFLQLAGNDPRFLSANRGILINADYVRSLDKKCCTMTDGSKFPVRIRGYQKLETAFHRYLFTKIRSEGPRGN